MASDISITWQRKKDYGAEYSHPYFDSGMVVIGRHHPVGDESVDDMKAMIKRGLSLGNAFSPWLWAMVALVPIFACIVFFLVENDQIRRNMFCRSTLPKNNFFHHVGEHQQDDGKAAEIVFFCLNVPVHYTAVAKCCNLLISFLVSRLRLIQQHSWPTNTSLYPHPFSLLFPFPRSV